MDNFGRKHLELFVLTTWTVWNQRNHVRLQLSATPLHQVAGLSKANLNEFQARVQVPEHQARQVAEESPFDGCLL